MKAPIHILERPHAKTIGLIADTHVPDRAEQLHPRISEVFQNTDLIIHAGDISRPQVLDQLNQIAETVAVRGNNPGDRKNFDPPLPEQLRIEVARNLTLGVWHGMQTAAHRFTDALIGRSGFFDYVSKRMTKRVRSKMPDPQIVIFGHAHWPVVNCDNNQLTINPGKAFAKHESSCAVLEILEDSARVKIHLLSEPGRLESLTKDFHYFPAI